MITLKTLPQATAQEVFDQVAQHLLAQGIKSMQEDQNCLYRLGDLKCAAGCLIGDDEYTPSMDISGVDKEGQSQGSAWNSLIKRELVPDTIHTGLIIRLQEIHDDNCPDEWEELLEEFADENNLDWNF